MNKKISCFLIAALLLTMILLPACSDKSDEEEVEKTVVNVLASSIYNDFGKAIGAEMEELMENIDFKVSGSGTVLANLRELGNDEVDMVIAQSDVIDDAYHGKGLFEGEKINNFSAIGAFYSEVCQLVVSKTSKIEKISDLKGKNVAVGENGSISEYNVERILKAYGLKMDDINVNNMGFKDSVEAMKNGDVDAIFFISGIPERNTMELAITDGARVINISGDELNALIEKYKYYVPYIIPAGTYSGQEEDITTIGVKSVLLATNAMDENLVYEITKTIFEHKDIIAESTVKDAITDHQFVTQGITIPFHPGAERYYEEAGTIK